MHLMIPFAAALGHSLKDHSLSALAQLQKLLPQLTLISQHGGSEDTLDTPFEKALAHALNWHGDDGCLPWAANAAQQDGISVAAQGAWGQITPVNWQVAADHIRLSSPEQLELSAADSRLFFQALQPLFEERGWHIVWGAPLRWYARHESLEHLPSASLERAIGRNIGPWLEPQKQLKVLQQLQNEVQMLLHQHPLNTERINQGHLPVNSFWLHGCGPAQAPAEANHLHIASMLRAPCLAQEWDTWMHNWQILDNTVIAALVQQAAQSQPCQLTLAGERLAYTFVVKPMRWWQRFDALRWLTRPTQRLQALLAEL
jgi:hypothetical protein